ncbi:MAG: ribokinase [Acidobacteria bacterium]|jgi:ribokinase|nr:ribokinase [Acidobacteriota bacterium]
MEKRIAVVGSINMDLVVAAQRIPLRGETVTGSNFQTFPGGKGANQAVAAARLGARVSMIGKLGRDAFAAQLIQSLHSAGVDTSAVDEIPGASGVALITTDATGDNSITIVAGANAQLTPQDLDAHLDVLRAADIILTQLETPLATVEHLALLAEREGIPLMLDPAPARPLPPSLLRRVAWLTPNETEADVLLGRPVEEISESRLADLAKALLAQGCRNVVLKLGARGCYLALQDGTRKLLPAYNVRAVDTTAAGDAFNGALATALSQDKDAVSSAAWASAVAAISVTRHGAQPSMPTAEEVSRFLETEVELNPLRR